VRVVTSENELTDAVKSSGADLILVDAGEASAVTAEIGKVPSSPSVLAVLNDATPADLERARAEGTCVAPAARKGRKVLQMVEEMLDRRSQGLPDVCRDTGPKA
jgi:hypothetical protein